MKKIIVLFAYLLGSALFLSLASACGSSSDNGGDEGPLHKPPSAKGDVLRLVSYNVGVFSKYEAGNYQTIANMMKELEADAMCIQELDSITTRTNYVYQLKHFASLMNWDFAYGGAMPYRGGAYGEGLATKDKILKKYNIALPKGEGAEPRVLVVAELEDFVLCSTHLDHVSAVAQLEQVRIINEKMMEAYGTSKKPVFIGADFNATPSSATISLLKEKWKVLSVQVATFSTDNPSKCIDYIMQLNNGVSCEVVRSAVPQSFSKGDVFKASDHFPIYVDVKLKK